jgi:RNA polymerase sigma factor (sigma-70 family)
MRTSPATTESLMGVMDIERGRWIATEILPLEPAVRAWLRRIRPAGVEADDLIQEAYARLAGLRSVDHIDQPRPYLFRIIKSLILANVRHAQVVAIESIAEMGELDISREETSPDRIVSARQELEWLAAAIESLPMGCREVFRLRKFEDLSQKELAMRLKISENTVEKQLARAVRLLMKKLGPVPHDRGLCHKKFTFMTGGISGFPHCYWYDLPKRRCGRGFTLTRAKGMK